MNDFFVEAGIQGIYVFTQDGLPVLERSYDPKLTNHQDGMLLGGFLSAIVNFAQSELAGLISDIGVKNHRLYVDYIPGLFFIGLFDEHKLKDVPVMHLHLLLKGIITPIKNLFLMELGDEEVEALNRPSFLHQYTLKIQSRLEELDNLIYKTYLETLEVFDEPILAKSFLQLANESDKTKQKELETKLKVELKKTLISTVNDISGFLKPRKIA